VVKQTKKITIILILFSILLIHLPFLKQAFHIDDTYFFYVAKQILRDPIHPLSFKINWDGTLRTAFDFSGSPPLFEYYLAIIMKFFGESERILHFSMIIYSIIISLCMYLLGKRFSKHPLSCVLLMLFSPAYLVMAHTIMLDIPALALFLAGVTCFIYGIDNDKVFLLISSAVILGLACLVKYNTLISFPFLIIYSLIKKGKWDKRILYLSISIIIFLIYNYYTSLVYGELHFSKAVTLIFSPHFFKMFVYLIALGSYIGGATIFPASPIFISFFLARKSLGPYLTLILSLLVGVFAKYTLGFNIMGASLLSFFIFAFLSFLYTLFQECEYRHSLKNKWVQDNIFLLAWIICIIGFHTLVVFVAVRYILYLIPPLIILFYRLLENKLPVKLVSTISIITITLTFSLGCLVSWADFLYANVYRNFSYNVAPNFKTKENTIWYAGHWGYQFYMDKQNYLQIENFSLLPKKGDILMIATRPEPEMIHPYLAKRLRMIDDVSYNDSFPIRTMNEESHVGFYSSSTRIKFTFLPFSFSNSMLEEFFIYEVVQ
jgi:4-amino-4-deoxy-L-arabinose transferase-like glycosyltransferase